MPYSLPSWIRSPGDLGAAYISAFHAGAAVAEEQARLSMQAQQAEIQAGAAEKRLEAQSLKEQQQLQLSKALHDAQLGLRQQELSQAQQRIQLTADKAARQLAAQTRYQQLRTAGVPADEAMLQVPDLFPSAAGLGSVAKEVYMRQHPFEPKDIVTPAGVRMVLESPQRAAQVREISPTGDITAGAVKAPTGETIPGMVSIGGRARNIPGYKDPKAREIAGIEKVWGPYLLGESQPGTEQKANYELIRSRWEELTGQKAVNWFNTPSRIPAPSAAPAAPRAGAAQPAAKRYKYNYFTGQLEEVTSEQ